MKFPLPAAVFVLATLTLVGLALARGPRTSPSVAPTPVGAAPEEAATRIVHPEPQAPRTEQGHYRHPGDDALIRDEQRNRLEQLGTRMRRQGSVPRTRHLKPDGTPTYTNRLIASASPYLQQHAHNPVNWFPWGEEAFERARALDRPIFLSIGYATCHWCHVMEEESFEDTEIAAMINAHFVPIKVDRETRPDVDRIYMSAVTLSLGRGGWPATLVLYPDRRPFFAATYLPARDGDRGRNRGLLGILAQIAEEWDGDRERLESFAARLTAAVEQDLASKGGADVPGEQAMQDVLAWARTRFDPVNGGVKGAPKFPSSLPVRLLVESQDEDAASMALTTLDAMAAGGIYDQLGGGFHRYSTDATWTVPHFEKMLYDNAIEARLYGEAFQRTGDLRYARVAEETLQAMIRDLGADGGGFCSALDADTLRPDGEIEEGWTYTWTPDELRQVLGDRAAAFQTAYGVTEGGNFEGRNILRQARPLTLQERDGFQADRLKLLLERRRRPQPLRDDKVLSSWNGLAIDALAYNGWLLGRDDWLEEARDAAERVLDARVDGRLLRVADEHGGVAFLSDYAFVTDGLITLFEATGERRWLDEALELVGTAETLYGDQGAWFRTPSDHEVLLTRDKPMRDQAIPSANSVLVRVFVRLQALTGDDAYRIRAEAIAKGLPISAQPAGYPNALGALAARPLHEVVVVTEPNERSSGLHAALKTSMPSRRVLVRQTEGEPPLVPLAQGKVRLGAPTVYVCRGGVCDRPVTDPESLVKLLR